MGNGIFFKNTAIANRFCATGGFLRRLENQQYVLGQKLFPADSASQFQKYGGVTVVTAGVHLTGML